MTDRFCVCGARVVQNTGGFDCPRCYRHYNVKGKLIGNDINFIQFDEIAKRKDITTMQYNDEEEEK
jgi:hypothetical protein